MNKTEALILAAAVTALVAIIALFVFLADWRLRCYEAHAERSAAELVLMCK